MRKYVVFSCLAILLSLATSARATEAADKYGAETDAVQSAKTISEFLAACPQDLNPCYDQMVNFKMVAGGVFATSAKQEAAMAATICMPLNYAKADFKAIFDWLVAHPETHHMDSYDGIIYAMKKLYPCM